MFDEPERNFLTASKAAAVIKYATASRRYCWCWCCCSLCVMAADTTCESHMMDAPTHDRSSNAAGPTAGSVRRTSEPRDRLIIAVSPRGTRATAKECTFVGGAPPATMLNRTPPHRSENIIGSKPTNVPPRERSCEICEIVLVALS